MKMSSVIRLIVAATGVAFFAAIATVRADDKEMEAKHAAVMVKSVFACPDCHSMALQAGKCAGCGKELVEQHLLGVKDGKALVCDCPSSCKCDATGIKDDKCVCAKAVGKVSAKGLYICPVGCPVISSSAGMCGGCGKDLTKVE
jgi:hypothetical protein